jgi:XTP/dITP diphosphohydrolase
MSGGNAAAIIGSNRLVLASNNAGKLAEFDSLLAPLGLQVQPQGAFGVGEAEEPYITFLENALTKARHAARETGLPALADDSGICVPALGGAPGVQSARFAGLPKSDARNNAQLVAALAALTAQAAQAAAGAGSLRSAYYYCVLVLVRHADDPQPLVADGVWQGEVIDLPRGAGGFGYDAHFLLPEQGLTAAEMPASMKNTLSHRAQALRALVQKLT